MSYPKQVMPEGFVFTSVPPPPPSLSQSSIHKIVEMNNWQKCEEMLKENKELVKAKGWNEISPLHSACIRNHVTIIQILLEHEADPNAKSSFDETPLHYACRSGFIKSVQILIEAGADVELVDKMGRGCIMFAMMGNSIAMINYLEKTTPLTAHSVNVRGESSLYVAYMQRNQILIQYLLNKNRCPIDYQDHQGNTLLHIAAKNGDSSMTWQLLSYSNCGLTHIENNDGYTPLKLAMKENTIKHQQLVKELQSYMKQPTLQPPKGPTMLWTAIFCAPFLWMSLVFFLCNFLNSHSGIFTMVSLLCMHLVITRQKHRIDHVCGWPNPIYLGLFISAIVHCIFIFFIKLLPGVWPSPFLFTSMMITSSCFLYHFQFLIFGDPGTYKDQKRNLSVLDISKGICSENDFCPFTEVIKPSNAKYCRICEVVVINIDHHCLYINNCVAVNNHRSFVLALLLIMMMQIIFLTTSYLYLLATYPSTLLYLSAISQLLIYKEPWLSGLICICIVAFLAESSLVALQLKNIALKQTSYYPNKSRFDWTKVCGNLFNFFFKTQSTSSSTSFVA